MNLTIFLCLCTHKSPKHCYTTWPNSSMEMLMLVKWALYCIVKVDIQIILSTRQKMFAQGTCFNHREIYVLLMYVWERGSPSIGQLTCSIWSITNNPCSATVCQYGFMINHSMPLSYPYYTDLNLHFPTTEITSINRFEVFISRQ